MLSVTGTVHAEIETYDRQGVINYIYVMKH